MKAVKKIHGCLFFNPDVFDHKFNGIFKMLDDTIKMPFQRSETFLENIFSRWNSHPRLKKPKPTKWQHNEFIIQHFSGDVLYNAVSFFYLNPQ